MSKIVRFTKLHGLGNDYIYVNSSIYPIKNPSTASVKWSNRHTGVGRWISLNQLWNRRQCTKFNGTSYITQRGAEAIYTEQGQKQVKNTISYYMTNAKQMKSVFENLGIDVYGGENAPYLWLKTPKNLSSWDFFDKMLYEANVVVTPGVGFGPSGEGFVRLTAFGDQENCLEAMKRIKQWMN